MVRIKEKVDNIKTDEDEIRQKDTHEKAKLILGIVLQILGALTPFILFILNLIPEYRENRVNLSFAGKAENGYFLESEEAFPNAYLLIQGQVVIKSKSNVMIKTFIIDDMYEKKVQATENKKFEIISYECPLADTWMEKLRIEVQTQLPSYGYDMDEIIIEKIGLATVWVQSKNRKSWFPVYYILEGESFTKVDKKTAENKMRGVMVTDELLKEFEKATVNAIMEETIEEVISELE